jgi:ABC-type nitrate/sulfonate/bicarbonate transport system substrate-binding protein
MQPHQQVLVRKESPYRSVEDLKGKPLALTPEVTALYNMFDFTMRKMGYDIEKDFDLKKLSSAGIIAALERGDVEGAVLWEAHISKLLATGRYKVILFLRDAMEKSLETEVKLMGWIGALQPWVKAHRDLIPKIRVSWRETWQGVQKDQAHFRKYAKELFGLDKPQVVDIGWERTSQFLLPPDFVWPNASALKVELSYLKQGVKMGMFPEKASDVIEPMFVP